MSCVSSCTKKQPLILQNFDLCAEFKKFEFSGREAFTVSESTVKQVSYYNLRLKKHCPFLFNEIEDHAD